MEAGGDARGLQQKGEGAQSRERAELPPPPTAALGVREQNRVLTAAVFLFLF